MRPLRAAFCAALCISVLFTTGYVLFFTWRLWIDISYAGNAVIVIYFVSTAFVTRRKNAMPDRSEHVLQLRDGKDVNELIRNPELQNSAGNAVKSQSSSLT